MADDELKLTESSLDWRTQVNIYQAIVQAVRSIDSAENAKNINEIRAGQPGPNAWPGPKTTS